MNYAEIIKQLFEEFRDKGAKVTVLKRPSNNGEYKEYDVAPLAGVPGLWLVHDFESDPPSRLRPTGLSVVKPKDFALTEPWNEHGSIERTKYFAVRSRLEEQDKKVSEVIWLQYSSWASPSFYPAMGGADRILAIHVRLQELLKTATPVSRKLEPEFAVGDYIQ